MILLLMVGTFAGVIALLWAKDGQAMWAQAWSTTSWIAIFMAGMAGGGIEEKREEDWGSHKGYREDNQGSKENRVKKQGSKELSLYIDTNDWWIGWYRGPNHHYICLLPTIVIRWKRFRDDEKAE